MPKYVLGISAYYHDSAACLIKDGKILAAAQEERFTRRRHDPAFPKLSIDFVLKEAGIQDINEIDHLVFYDKPIRKFDRLLKTYLAYAPKGFESFSRAVPGWLTEKLHLRRDIAKQTGYRGKILFSEHHESHAASAFYPSPFERAAILCMDGVGEWATTSIWLGEGASLDCLAEIRFPHSLGLLYSAFTSYTGFKINSGEYKVMGLAPYGNPKYAPLIFEKLIDLKDDGSFRLNMEYFDYCHGKKMFNERFEQLFGGPARAAETPLTQREMDLAASVQKVTEEVVLKLGRHAHSLTGAKDLCLAGGVALNCVANGRLDREGPFDRVWIQPAAGDAGGALGAALAVWHRYLGQERPLDVELDRQNGSYLGPDYTESEIESFLSRAGANYRKCSDTELYDELARLIGEGKVVGWFSGKMEFGPRALGARSIIGDPRNDEMQKKMNLKIKYRESFRPFAPAVLADDASSWFEMSSDSPYMLLVTQVAPARKIAMSEEHERLFGIDKLNVKRSTIPAITHVDYSARVQTVHEETNPRFSALIRKFKDLTGCPVMINTSFNVRGEPIVCSPEDAYRCFMRTEIDVLVLENFLLLKSEQPNWKETSNWKQEFELD